MPRFIRCGRSAGKRWGLDRGPSKRGRNDGRAWRALSSCLEYGTRRTQGLEEGANEDASEHRHFSDFHCPPSITLLFTLASPYRPQDRLQEPARCAACWPSHSSNTVAVARPWSFHRELASCPILNECPAKFPTSLKKHEPPTLKVGTPATGSPELQPTQASRRGTHRNRLHPPLILRRR